MEGEDRFSYARLVEMSQQMHDSIGKIDVELFEEYMELYVKLLKLMGKLVEIGFSDIIAKTKILKDNKKYFEEKGTPVGSCEELVETEILLGLEQLNGSNNKKKGFKKDSEWFKWVGSSRTLLRLNRFLLFVQNIVTGLVLDKEKSFKDIVKEAYSTELAPYHSFMIKTAVKGILYMMPNRESFLTSSIGEDDLTHEQVYEMMDIAMQNVDKVTKYLSGFYEERNIAKLD